MQTDTKELPIGVFDSGVGGLTVLRALRDRLPHEHLLYLGDTARVPYGTKSRDSVIRYAIQATDALIARGVKAVVIACNTASAVAVEPIRHAHPELPVIGVIEPGAERGCAASRSGRIAVIATDGTIRAGAYHEAIRRRRPDAHISAQPCSLFVALAEEGWTRGPLVEQIVGHYLQPLFNGSAAAHPDCLVLGCTHFPVLRDAIRKSVGEAVEIVDSATTTAAAVEAMLREHGLTRCSAQRGSSRFLATDSIARFCAIGGIFYGNELNDANVELVDL